MSIHYVPDSFDQAEGTQQKSNRLDFHEKARPDYVASGPAFIASLATNKRTMDEEGLARWQNAATILVKVAYRVASADATPASSSTAYPPQPVSEQNQ